MRVEGGVATGCCRSTAARSSFAPGSRRRSRRAPRRAGRPGRGRGAVPRRGPSRPGGPRPARAGDGEDALRARGRRRPRRVLPPLPPRPACSGRCCAAGPLPAAASAVALGGAGLGRRQAADRVRPGGRDPAPHRRPLGPAAWARARGAPRDVPVGATIAGRAPAELESMGLAPVARSRFARAAARSRPALRPRRRPAAATGGSWRSPRSAPGRSSAWASTAAATPTRCRSATSST